MFVCFLARFYRSIIVEKPRTRMKIEKPFVGGSVSGVCLCLCVCLCTVSMKVKTTYDEYDRRVLNTRLTGK